jgi:hypothetical protein
MKTIKFSKEKTLNWAIGIFFILAMIRFVATPKETAKPDEVASDFSTLIPSGFVLVPIEIENSLSLEGVLGDVGGYVDLYESNGKGAGKKLAHHVKLVRAPKDPRQFAVLTHQDMAPRLVRHDGPLIATMRNPKDDRPEPKGIIPRRSATARIIYGESVR